MKHFVTRFLMSTAAALGLFFAAPAGAAGPVELNMYYPIAVGGALTKLVDDLVAGFERENPGIKVNAIYAGNYDDARIKALAALKSGKPAQLSVLFSIDIYELIEQDAIVAFDDIAKSAEEKAWLKSFYPGLMANGTFKGKVYGIPFQRSTIVMYHNKDAFREAGLDPNKPPTNWTEMAEMSKKLVKRDAAGQVQRWGVMIPSTGYAYWMLGALAMENGQVLMNADGDTTYYDNPAVVGAVQYWYDLSHKYDVMPKGTVEWGTLRADFLDGKTAIMWHTTGNLTAVKDAAKFDFGVSMLPAAKRRGSPTGGGNFYIFKQTTPEERVAAMKLIRYLTAPEQAAKWSIGTGYLATSQAAYDTKTMKDYAAGFPYALVARDQLPFATAELSTFQTGRVRKLLDDAIQSVLTDKATPEAALKAAQAQADPLLRRYRSAK